MWFMVNLSVMEDPKNPIVNLSRISGTLTISSSSVWVFSLLGCVISSSVRIFSIIFTFLRFTFTSLRSKLVSQG